MTQANLSEIKDRISDIAQKSTIADRVKGIILEPVGDDEGADFLRVIVAVKSFDGVSDADLAALTASIEDAVGEIDNRFPSVRFADAA